MADIAYIKELVMAEKGKPTELKRYNVAYDYGSTLARAYLNANQTGVADGVVTKVLLDAESFDIGSNFASNKYVCPVTGYYQVSARVNIYNTAGGDVIVGAYASVYKNGAAAIPGSGIAVATGNMNRLRATVSGVIYCAVTDYLELYGVADTSDASTCQFDGGETNTFMSVHLIST